jgi:hypothetical protein
MDVGRILLASMDMGGRSTSPHRVSSAKPATAKPFPASGSQPLSVGYLISFTLEMLMVVHTNHALFVCSAGFVRMTAQG